MKAAFIRHYGNNDAIEISHQPMPAIGPHDVLIKVHAASINPVDYKIRDGDLKVILPLKFPLILGNDCSGEVEKIGTDVRAFKPGDAVYARVDKDRIGTFAEYAVAAESSIALKPNNLSYIEAASIPLVGLTAWQALIDIGKLTSGGKVLVHAGSGGVGTFAIQLAKHWGAAVATTASARNADLLKQLGADIVIDYKTQRFEEMLSDYDLVFDTQAGETPTALVLRVKTRRHPRHYRGHAHRGNRPRMGREFSRSHGDGVEQPHLDQTRAGTRHQFQIFIHASQRRAITRDCQAHRKRRYQTAD